MCIRDRPDLQAICFKQKNTLQCSIPETPPWLLSHPCVNFDLHLFYKDDTAPDIYRSMFYEICASYDNFDHIYTDGSKMGDRVASAAICSNMVRSTRLPNNARIFRAELYAVTLAMYFVCRSRNSNFVIFSDSMCRCADVPLRTYTLTYSLIHIKPMQHNSIQTHTKSMQLPMPCILFVVAETPQLRYIFSDSISNLEALNGFKLEMDLVQKITKEYTHLTNNHLLLDPKSRKHPRQRESRHCS